MTTEIGPYRVEQELARGANGVVLRAQGPQGQVAIKLLRPERLEDPDDVTRFHREGEVAARLNHRAIVPLLDRGQCEHGPYHVYAFVPGESLDQRVHREQRLGPAEAARIALELCSALEHAHAHGVLHRDLKPANVLMTVSGEPRLTDFGLAKDGQSDSRLTVSGEIMGSPVFMPPEQALGRRDQIGPGSDVYGLGAVLYTLLTGDPPVRGESLEDVLQKVVRAPVVSPATVVPTTPVELAAICMRCLEKHPDDRYPTMQALGADLRGFLDPAKPAAVTPSFRTPALVGGLGGLAISVALIAVVHSLRADPAPTDLPLVEPVGAWKAPTAAPEPKLTDFLGEAAKALNRKDWPAAQAAAEQALEFDAQSGEAYLLLGKVAIERGERVAGLEHWGKAAKLGTHVEPELRVLYEDPTLRRLVWITFVPSEGTLVEGLLLCTKWVDTPELDVPGVLEQFEELALSFEPELAGLSGVPRVQKLLDLTARVVGPSYNYSHPDSGRIARALETQRGNHLTCTAILITLGSRLGVELQGICFPGWYLARTPDEPPVVVNAFAAHVMSPEEIEHSFDKNTRHRTFKPSVLAPATRQETLVRALLFYAGAHRTQGNTQHMERSLELARILAPENSSAVERRALGNPKGE